MIRNILAVVAGLVTGSYCNMLIIENGHHLMTLPEGFRFSDPENMKNGLMTLAPQYFAIPFLAHAAGVLIGGIIAALLGKGNKKRNAFVISLVFLLAGITMVFLMEAPLWFEITDLSLAYLPMGYLAGKIAGGKS
jgi:hypothetical protein